MNKHEIIKEHVLKDRDSFSLAFDIYSEFLAIREFLKYSICILLETQIKSEISEAKTVLHRGYANNQYIDILYNDKVKIQIEFWNFFRTPFLTISGADDALYKEINEVIQSATISNDIIQLNMNGYGFNKITEILDLYNLYNDGNLKEELKENFHNHVLIPVKKIYDTIARTSGTPLIS